MVVTRFYSLLALSFLRITLRLCRNNAYLGTVVNVFEIPKSVDDRGGSKCDIHTKRMLIDS